MTYLPVPFLLETKRDHKITQNHYQHVREHGGQSHLRLSDTAVPLRRSCREPVRKRAIGGQTDESADENRKVHETDRLAREVVRRSGEVLRLGQVDGEEGAGRPRNHEGGEFDNGVTEKLPRDPKIERKALKRMCVRLPGLPLLFRRTSPPKIWITFCRGCGGEILGKLVCHCVGGLTCCQAFRVLVLVVLRGRNFFI